MGELRNAAIASREERQELQASARGAYGAVQSLLLAQRIAAVTGGVVEVGEPASDVRVTWAEGAAAPEVYYEYEGESEAVRFSLPGDGTGLMLRIGEAEAVKVCTLDQIGDAFHAFDNPPPPPEGEVD